MIRVSALLLLLAVACQKPDAKPPVVESSAAPVDTSARRKIVFAGTSLTAGLGLDPDSAYPNLIQAKLDSAKLDFEAVNAGVSGETTAGLLQRLDWLLRGQFDVFVIESGANDGLRGVGVEAIESNLRQIIGRVRDARPAARIALVQMEALPNYGRPYGSAFHDLYVRVARDEKVTLLPFLLEGVAGRAELNQNDGLHPTTDGERIVAANVWRGLQPLLKRAP
jgi:acyl-CoA thioesterase I